MYNEDKTNINQKVNIFSGKIVKKILIKNPETLLSVSGLVIFSCKQ